MIKNIFTIILSLQVINTSFAQNNKIENNTTTNEQLYEFLNSNKIKQDLNYYLNQPKDYMFSNDIPYWGELKNGLPNGLGLLYKKDKVFYIGEFKNGKCEGTGTKISPIDICIGSFLENKFNGYGVSYVLTDTMNFQKNISLYFENKLNAIIETKFKSKFIGLLTGKDEIIKDINPSLTNFIGSVILFMDLDSTFSKKIITTGNYKNQTYVSDGTFEIEYLNPKHPVLKEIYYGNPNFINGTPDSLIYHGFSTTGHFLKGEGIFSDMHDFKGTLYSLNKFTYNGSFKNFDLVGVGKMHRDELDYEGEFLKSLLHGKGKVVFKEGSKYKSGSYWEGIFENDQFINGVFYNSETNEYFKGNFINGGNPDGKISITINGKTTQAIFKDGVKQTNNN
jgi:hypothetical protein